ncbi:hypothetical protein BDW02DRAFT_608699 [Decorospora gaudefroyi]|uniref:Protein kinase domain-containing protein n=1 Tax=Decorospora gaudefroyi TaxID=184978 RepID=A0A6A5K7N0_9PLEO|nr:hypothetical protein BDW02DRAFT_608699 [Decorospora gaudefroyi]
MTQLRCLPQAKYVGTDRLLILYWSGLLLEVPDFHATLTETFVSKSKGLVGSYMRGMMNTLTHGIVFTHGDLRPDDIIVRNGRVVAIIDGGVVS